MNAWLAIPKSPCLAQFAGPTVPTFNCPIPAIAQGVIIRPP